MKTSSVKIASGYQTGLLLLSKNPLIDITHTETIDAVEKANDNSRSVNIHTRHR